MATYVIGLILLVLLGMAGRHVYRNMVDGKHDCCGCDTCSGHHDKKSGAAATATAAEEEKPCCCCHK